MTVKLCKNCKWMNEYAQCECPAIPLLDLVKGKHHVYFCEVARHSDSLCGIEAEYFEPKP